MLRIFNAEHIHCRSDDLVQGENKCVIDSSVNMNIIKISAQKDHIIIVNEKEKRNIKGINTATILTAETVVVEIFIKKQTFNEKFEDFSTPEAGVLGIAFLKTNEVIIDMETEKLIIPESISRPDNNTSVQ